MYKTTSSATFRREDGPGAFSMAGDARAGQCIGGRSHRWRLKTEIFPLFIGHELVDAVSWTDEKCGGCGALRPFIGRRYIDTPDDLPEALF